MEKNIWKSHTQQVPNKYPTSTQQVLELVGILKDREYSVREIMSFLMLKDWFP